MLYKYNSKELIFEKVSLKSYLLGLFGIVFVFSSFSFTAAVDFNNAVERIPVIIRMNEEKFSPENLKKEIQKLNIKHPEVVFNQAIVEGASKTGKRWSNPKFIEGNNFLGLKRAYLRPSTAMSWDNEGYCLYNNWRDCLIDYSLFQAQNCKNIRTDEEYYIFLKELGYSVNSNYNNLLKSVK